MIMNFFGCDHDHYDNKTQSDKKHQNEDLDGNLFPAELWNNPRVCKKFYYENNTSTYVFQYSKSRIHRSLLFL